MRAGSSRKFPDTLSPPWPVNAVNAVCSQCSQCCSLSLLVHGQYAVNAHGWLLCLCLLSFLSSAFGLSFGALSCLPPAPAAAAALVQFCGRWCAGPFFWAPSWAPFVLSPLGGQMLAHHRVAPASLICVKSCCHSVRLCHCLWLSVWPALYIVLLLVLVLAAMEHQLCAQLAPPTNLLAFVLAVGSSCLRRARVQQATAGPSLANALQLPHWPMGSLPPR